MKKLLIATLISTLAFTLTGCSTSQVTNNSSTKNEGFLSSIVNKKKPSAVLNGVTLTVENVYTFETNTGKDVVTVALSTTGGKLEQYNLTNYVNFAVTGIKDGVEEVIYTPEGGGGHTAPFNPNFSTYLNKAGDFRVPMLSYNLERVCSFVSDLKKYDEYDEFRLDFKYYHHTMETKQEEDVVVDETSLTIDPKDFIKTDKESLAKDRLDYLIETYVDNDNAQTSQLKFELESFNYTGNSYNVGIKVKNISDSPMNEKLEYTCYIMNEEGKVNNIGSRTIPILAPNEEKVINLNKDFDPTENYNTIIRDAKEGEKFILKLSVTAKEGNKYEKEECFLHGKF